ncbi:hypothetical protein GN956_G1191 [Arapaima gigas]
MEKPQVQRCSEPGNTSDEDQEDLPFDGDQFVTDANLISDRQNIRFPDLTSISPCLKEQFVAQAAPIDSDLCNNKNIGKSPLSAIGAEVYRIQHLISGNCRSNNESMDHGHNEVTGPVDNRTAHKTPHSDIPNILLRHLSQEELFTSSKYIEAETLPEVSFIDSVEETVLAKLPHSPRDSIECSSTLKMSLCAYQDSKLNPVGKTPVIQSGDPEKSEESQRTECRLERDMVQVCSEQPETEPRSSSPKQVDEAVQISRAKPCHELKYGQGQVHYPLPDFSKVLPKVKIPKGSDSGRPEKLQGVLQNQPSPSYFQKFNKATIEVINQVLEDSVQLPEMTRMCSNQQKHHRDQSKTPETIQDLQHLLYLKFFQTRRLRINFLFIYCLFSVPPLEYRHGLKEYVKMDQGPSEGEKMTAEFENIIIQFQQKLEEFKISLNCMSASISDQHMIFKTLMDAKDQLETKYIVKKEEHRVLEMQNYLGLAKNTGIFDPERQVEGEIFKIGMILEDIKDQIDKNTQSQLSLPTSSSSPLSLLPVDTFISSPSSLPQKCQTPDLVDREDSLVYRVGGSSESKLVIHADSSKHFTSQGYQDASLDRLELISAEEEKAAAPEGPFGEGTLHRSPAAMLQKEKRKPERFYNKSISTLDI